MSYRKLAAIAVCDWTHVRRTLLGVVVLLGWSVASIALASQESELLYSRGLVAFHAGQYQEALQAFDQAVAADPADVYALYYRGVTYGRLNNYDAAIRDLRAVVDAKPAMEQAGLELGVALVQDSRYEEAVPVLEKAQAASTLDAQASLFLGIAQLRLGRLDEARQNLARAAQRDPSLEVSSRYYQGLTECQAGNADLAQQHLDWVVARSPESALGRAATAALARIHEVPIGAAVRPLTLYGSVGYQYDDNVQLLTDVKLPGASTGRADSRFTLQAGAAYASQAFGGLRWALGYEFFQSLHFHLTDYNLQDNRLSLQLANDIGPAQLGFFASYDFYVRDTDSYLSQGLWMPWAGFEEGTLGRTEVFVRTRYRDYLDRPENGAIESTNYSPGLRQYLYLGAPNRYLFGGYRYDRNEPFRSSGDPYGYDGNELSGGGGWHWPWDIQTDVAYGYHREKYFSESQGRRDEEHQLVFAAAKNLTDYVTLNLGYLGTFNNSNKALFRYDRNIGSVSVFVRY